MPVPGLSLHRALKEEGASSGRVAVLWVTRLSLNSFPAASAQVTRVWAWSSVLHVSAGVCVGQATAGLPLCDASTPLPGQLAWAVALFQASLQPAAGIYTEENQVISDSQFGQEAWPKGDLRAELREVGSKL